METTSARPGDPHPGTSSPATITAAVIDDADGNFKRRLGWLSLAFLTFTSMMGSGWLFAAYYAGSMAGPAALLSWIVAAVATALVALTFIELGVTRPIAGGNTRWPSMMSGPFMGIMVGWLTLVSTAFGMPSEASGLVQYASGWWPAVLQDGKLSAIGLTVAALVLVLVTILNMFGVMVMTRIAIVLTIFKIAVPLLTIALLLASGFDGSNVATGGGFAPFGAGGVLTAVVSAGLIYSFGGVQIPALMAGETKNPRRNLPIGTFVGFGAAFVVYMLLQVSFIWTVPNSMLAEAGWHGLNFDSPFAQLAGLLGLSWLIQLLLIDAVVSPGTGLLTGMGVAGRNTYGLGQSRFLPAMFAKVTKKTGIPVNALIFNLVISIVFLLMFQSWQGLVAALGFYFAVGYGVIAVAASVSQKDPRLVARPWMKRGMPTVAAVSFIISGLLMYWSGWNQVWVGVALFIVAVPIAVIKMLQDRKVFTPRLLLRGLWFPVYLIALLGLSAIGSFGGTGTIPAPWDSVVAAVVAGLFFWWGHRDSAAWLASPEAEKAVGVYY
ncbi:amino acid transporter [Microbacterium sp. AG790]|uniref:APC family permease n=1 Tax=Microbacterium sp. AG790 TaxID=2183995 RepID=UPI000F12016C|nr:APC family permease [Microbacterium sp. AG790]RKS89485.1 amino acid transporter [Microbacterium sp. AG790]